MDNGLAEVVVGALRRAAVRGVRMNKMNLTSNTLLGPGSAMGLIPGMLDVGATPLGVVVDEAVASLAPTTRLLDALRDAGVMISRIERVSLKSEPSYDLLDELASRFRDGSYRGILGIGGGSTMDLAKGVAVLATNPGNGLDYRGMDKVGRPGLPVFLVPTTAGTGSEVTPTASFIDTLTHTKLGINGRYVACEQAALDATFVASCPREPSIAAGLDAFVHAVEAVTCRTANPYSRLNGSEGIRLLFEGFAKSLERPADLDSRQTVLLGSHFAGIAMRNAGGGPASGVSYPLGVHFQVPHGFAGGVLLPHAVAMNIEKGYVEGYARIASHVHLSGAADAHNRATAFRDMLFALWEEVGAPANLSRFGLGRSELETLVELTMTERKGNLDLNPVPFDESDVRALLERVLE